MNRVSPRSLFGFSCLLNSNIFILFYLVHGYLFHIKVKPITHKFINSSIENISSNNRLHSSFMSEK